MEQILLEAGEDPFEFHYTGGVQRQKTMPGYHFANMSPPGQSAKGEMMIFGASLEEVRPISKARRSLYPSLPPIPIATLEQHADLLPPPSTPTHPLKSTSTAIRPTFRRLFALSRRRDYILHLIPAIVVAVAASLVPPYMSVIIGNAFAVFTAYPFDTRSASIADKAALAHGVRQTSIQLAVAGGLSVLLNYLKGALWTLHGEGLVSRLREAVYEGVQTKGMSWFDKGMGMKEEDGDEKGESIGAGGLMAKFTR